MSAHLADLTIWTHEDRRNSEVLRVPRFGINERCSMLEDDVKALREEVMRLQAAQPEITSQTKTVVDQPAAQDDSTLVVKSAV